MLLLAVQQSSQCQQYLHCICEKSQGKMQKVLELDKTCTLEASLQVFDRTKVRTPVSVSRLNWSTFCRQA